MDWFRHQSSSRNDPKLVAIRRKFGPAAELVWWHLIEVCVQEESPLLVIDGDYKTARAILALEPEWKLDLPKVLHTMTDVGLVAHDQQQGLDTFQPVALNEYIGAASETREAWRERKRKQREKERANREDTGTSRSDVTGTSPGLHDTDLDQEEDLNTPLPPAKRGGLRAFGQNPRTLAAKTTAQADVERLRAELQACDDCGDSDTRFCSRCDFKRRQLLEAEAVLAS